MSKDRPTVTPLRCKTLGHDYDYVRSADGSSIVKKCTRCGKPWEEEVD